MKSVQQMIMDYVDECAEEFGHVITISQDYSNTGNLYMFKGDKTFKVKFNFQTDDCTLTYSTTDRGYYSYGSDILRLKKHLRSFVKCGNPNTLR